jgi:hypothetical protein
LGGGEPRKFGTLYIENSPYRGNAPYFSFDVHPAAAMRLKGLFPKVRKEGWSKRIVISKTDSNARDLVWFIERFPMEMDDAVRAELNASSGRYLRVVSDAYAVVNKPGAVTRQYPMALPPREYQKKAAELVMTTGGLLLGDDLGLGKTGRPGVLLAASCVSLGSRLGEL